MRQAWAGFTVRLVVTPTKDLYSWGQASPTNNSGFTVVVFPRKNHPQQQNYSLGLTPPKQDSAEGVFAWLVLLEEEVEFFFR